MNKIKLGIIVLLLLFIFAAGCVQLQEPETYATTAKGEIQPLTLEEKEYTHPEARFLQELAQAIMNSFQ